MNSTTIFAGGAALGLLTALWQQIRAVLWKICSLFIQRVELLDMTTHELVIGHLQEQCQVSRFYQRVYAFSFDYIRQHGKMCHIPYEKFGLRSLLFWHRSWPILWMPLFADKDSQQRQANDPQYKPCSAILTLRGSVDVQALVVAACQASSQTDPTASQPVTKQTNRFVVKPIPDLRHKTAGDDSKVSTTHRVWHEKSNIRIIGYRRDQIGLPVKASNALDQLVLPAQLRNLTKEIVRWRNSELWYKRHSLPWKRGWCLFGPPGSGKTALARAFAEDLNMPLYVYNLPELNNAEFIRNWRTMQLDTPCIALIEDIDNVFHGRQNICHGRPGESGTATTDAPVRVFNTLTFDCLLNCLDGVERSEGVFTIITTNDISKIDPALGQPRRAADGSMELVATRPGRIDKAVELTYLDATGMAEMANRILAECPEELATLHNWINANATSRETPSQFQERCAQLALARHWNDQRQPVSK